MIKNFLYGPPSLPALFTIKQEVDGFIPHKNAPVVQWWGRQPTCGDYSPQAASRRFNSRPM